MAISQEDLSSLSQRAFSIGATEDEEKKKAQGAQPGFQMPKEEAPKERPQLSEEETRQRVFAPPPTEGVAEPESRGIVKPLVRGIGKGFQQGVADFPDSIDYLAGKISDLTGLPRTDLFKKISDAIRPEDIDKDEESLAYQIGHAIGWGGENLAELLAVWMKPFKLLKGAKVLEAGKLFTAGGREALELQKLAPKLAKLIPSAEKAGKEIIKIGSKEIPIAEAKAMLTKAATEAPKAAKGLAKFGAVPLSMPLGLGAVGAMGGAKGEYRAAEARGEKPAPGAELKGAMKHGAIGAGTGVGLGVLNSFSLMLRVPTMGAMFGGMALAEGAPTKKVAAEFVTGALWGLLPGGEETTKRTKAALGDKSPNVKRAGVENPDFLGEEKIAALQDTINGIKKYSPQMEEANKRLSMMTSGLEEEPKVDFLRGGVSEEDARHQAYVEKFDKQFAEGQESRKGQKVPFYLDTDVGAILGDKEFVKTEMFEKQAHGDPIELMGLINDRLNIFGQGDNEIVKAYARNFAYEATDGKAGQPYIVPGSWFSGSHPAGPAVELHRAFLTHSNPFEKWIAVDNEGNKHPVTRNIITKMTGDGKALILADGSQLPMENMMAMETSQGKRVWEKNEPDKTSLRAKVKTKRIEAKADKVIKETLYVPPSSEKALEHGKTITREEAKRYMKEYRKTASKLSEEPTKEELQAYGDKATKRQLMREVVESHLGLGARESLVPEEIEARLGEKVKPTEVVKEKAKSFTTGEDVVGQTVDKNGKPIEFKGVVADISEDGKMIMIGAHGGGGMEELPIEKVFRAGEVPKETAKEKAIKGRTKPLESVDKEREALLAEIRKEKPAKVKAPTEPVKPKKSFAKFVKEDMKEDPKDILRKMNMDKTFEGEALRLYEELYTPPEAKVTGKDKPLERSEDTGRIQRGTTQQALERLGYDKDSAEQIADYPEVAEVIFDKKWTPKEVKIEFEDSVDAEGKKVKVPVINAISKDAKAYIKSMAEKAVDVTTEAGATKEAKAVTERMALLDLADKLNIDGAGGLYKKTGKASELDLSASERKLFPAAQLLNKLPTKINGTRADILKEIKVQAKKFEGETGKVGPAQMELIADAIELQNLKDVGKAGEAVEAKPKPEAVEEKPKEVKKQKIVEEDVNQFARDRLISKAENLKEASDSLYTKIMAGKMHDVDQAKQLKVLVAERAKDLSRFGIDMSMIENRKGLVEKIKNKTDKIEELSKDPTKVKQLEIAQKQLGKMVDSLRSLRREGSDLDLGIQRDAAAIAREAKRRVPNIARTLETPQRLGERVVGYSGARRPSKFAPTITGQNLGPLEVREMFPSKELGRNVALTEERGVPLSLPEIRALGDATTSLHKLYTELDRIKEVTKVEKIRIGDKWIIGSIEVGDATSRKNSEIDAMFSSHRGMGKQPTEIMGQKAIRRPYSQSIPEIIEDEVATRSMPESIDQQEALEKAWIQGFYDSVNKGVEGTNITQGTSNLAGATQAVEPGVELGKFERQGETLEKQASEFLKNLGYDKHGEVAKEIAREHKYPAGRASSFRPEFRKGYVTAERTSANQFDVKVHQDWMSPTERKLATETIQRYAKIIKRGGKALNEKIDLIDDMGLSLDEIKEKFPWVKPRMVEEGATQSPHTDETGKIKWETIPGEERAKTQKWITTEGDWYKHEMRVLSDELRKASKEKDHVPVIMNGLLEAKDVGQGPGKPKKRVWAFRDWHTDFGKGDPKEEHAIRAAEHEIKEYMKERGDYEFEPSIGVKRAMEEQTDWSKLNDVEKADRVRRTKTPEEWGRMSLEERKALAKEARAPAELRRSEIGEYQSLVKINGQEVGPSEGRPLSKLEARIYRRAQASGIGKIREIKGKSLESLKKEIDKGIGFVRERPIEKKVPFDTRTQKDLDRVVIALPAEKKASFKALRDSFEKKTELPNSDSSETAAIDKVKKIAEEQNLDGSGGLYNDKSFIASREAIDEIRQRLENVSHLGDLFEQATDPKLRDQYGRDLLQNSSDLKGFVEYSTGRNLDPGDHLNEARRMVESQEATVRKLGPGDEHLSGGRTLNKTRRGLRPYRDVDEGYFEKASHSVADLGRKVQNAYVEFRKGKVGAITDREKRELARDVIEMDVSRMDPLRRKEFLSSDPTSEQIVSNKTMMMYLAGGDLSFVDEPIIAKTAVTTRELRNSYKGQIRNLVDVEFKPIKDAIKAAASKHGVTEKEASRKLGEALYTKTRYTGWDELDNIIPKWQSIMDRVSSSQAGNDLLKDMYVDKYFPFIPDYQKVYDVFRSKFQLVKDPSQVFDGWNELNGKQQDQIKSIFHDKKYWDNPEAGRSSLDRPEQEFLKKFLYEHYNIYDSRSRMPQEMAQHFSEGFNRHLQSRKGHPDWLEPDLDAQEVFKSYAYSMARTNLNRTLMSEVMPSLERYKFPERPNSIRHILDQQMKAAFSMPTRDELAGRVLINKFNSLYAYVPEAIKNITFGKELPQQTSSYTGGVVGGIAKGALGYVTAIKKMTMLVNGMAEYGPGPILKNMAKVLRHPLNPMKALDGIPGAKETFNLFGFRHAITEDIMGGGAIKWSDFSERFMNAGTPGKKAFEVYDYFGRVMLHPITWSTDFKNTITFLTALDEAKSRGFSMDQAFRHGLKKLINTEHDTIIPEAVYKAGMDVAEQQFVWTKEGRSPVMRGPLASMGSLFTRFPVRETQTLWNGISNNLLMGEDARALRYTLATGFFLGIPVMAGALGLQASGLLDQFGRITPFPVVLDTIGGLYHAALGRGEAQKQSGWDTFKNAVGTMFIPQYQTGRKLYKTYNAAIDGVWKDSKKGLAVAEASPFELVSNALGFPPKAAKEASELIMAEASQRATAIGDARVYRDKAVKALGESNPTQAMAIIQEANKKGIAISRQSVWKAYEAQKNSNYLREHLKNVPKHRKQEVQQRIKEYEEEYFPSKSKKQEGRSLWSKDIE